MTEPSGDAGLRAFLGPEAVGGMLAAVIVLALVLGSGLPALGGATPSVEPSAPTPSGSAAASASSLSPTTRGALVTALAVNQRLAGHAEALQAAVDGDDATGATIAPMLRTMNPDLEAGVDAADLIARDPLTAALGQDLGAFYAQVSGRSTEALGLSVQEDAAFRAAARDVIAILEALPALDDRIADALEGRAGPSAAASESPSASIAPSAPPSSAPPAASPSASGGPSASPVAPSLIDNGTFDTDLAGWTLEVDAGSAALAAHDPAGGPDGSGSARVDITAGSSARAGIAFVSAPFELERGRRYRVTASIRSTAEREVRLRIATVGGRTTIARTFVIGATWSSTVFEMTELLAGSTSVLALDLGRGDEPVWLDNVSIVPIGG